MPDQRLEITEGLAALSRGAPEAMDRLMPLVYGELKRLAHRQLGAEAGGHTLSTTAVVHEAYLRLAEQSRAPWIAASFLPWPPAPCVASSGTTPERIRPGDAEARVLPAQSQIGTLGRTPFFLARQQTRKTRAKVAMPLVA